MQTVIGVRLRKAGKIHYFRPGQAEIQKGDFVVIETAQGVECVEVIIAPREIASDKFKIDFIRRKAGPYDLARLADNKKREQAAFDICRQKILEHNLPMNLIGVSYSFDLSKIVFSFTAAGRVDFRELVKDLASVFHTRIELHQVGVRDEAKFMGGVGCCGRALCCSTFLGDFIPVSIRMAKEQNLSLNPAKISGICGRLMCCLKFENDFYRERYPHEVIKDPKLGDRVIVDEGEGTIISLNMQRKTATINLDNSRTVIASFENIFEAEISVEDAQTIIAPMNDDSDLNDDVEKNVSSYKTDYKADYKTDYKADNKYEHKTDHKTDTKTEKYQQRNNRNIAARALSTLPNRPNYQNKSNIPVPNKFNNSAQNKSSGASNKPNTLPQTKSADSAPIKSNNRGREERNKDSRKFSKKGRRNEDYQRNKKFRPRRPDIDNDDE